MNHATLWWRKLFLRSSTTVYTLLKHGDSILPSNDCLAACLSPGYEYNINAIFPVPNQLAPPARKEPASILKPALVRPEFSHIVDPKMPVQESVVEQSHPSLHQPGPHWIQQKHKNGWTSSSRLGHQNNEVPLKEKSKNWKIPSMMGVFMSFHLTKSKAHPFQRSCFTPSQGPQQMR